ncbi:hypothetical protein HaLaN_13223 [Haematococcus lacustris]|uniref:Uncharacterized protein n=1 Tax=Haematococcus lacustris TaxID=44745 RepID=A0A699ZBU7_HAELA|nr:hypothetical protein HaLaN_13223 [Haematococcus lacustris]
MKHALRQAQAQHERQAMDLLGAATSAATAGGSCPPAHMPPLGLAPEVNNPDWYRALLAAAASPHHTDTAPEHHRGRQAPSPGRLDRQAKQNHGTQAGSKLAKGKKGRQHVPKSCSSTTSDDTSTSSSSRSTSSLGE